MLQIQHMGGITEIFGSLSLEKKVREDKGNFVYRDQCRWLREEELEKASVADK